MCVCESKPHELLCFKGSQNAKCLFSGGDPAVGGYNMRQLTLHQINT